MGGRFKSRATYVYLGLIHVVVWRKSTPYCKAVILQLKRKKEMDKKLHKKRMCRSQDRRGRNYAK